jgi:hypothetical protein
VTAGCCSAVILPALQLELHRYATGTQSRVVTAMTLLKSHLFRCGRLADCYDAAVLPGRATSMPLLKSHLAQVRRPAPAGWGWGRAVQALAWGLRR